MDSLVCLTQLPSGQQAFIRGLFGPPEQVHRLKEFGLREGLEIEVFRAGNPCILKIGGVSKVCLRADTKVEILVQPLAEYDPVAPRELAPQPAVS